MSKALDKLDATVKAEVSAGSAVKSMTRDQLLDEINNVTNGLRTNLKFFTGLGDNAAKLRDWYLDERKANSKLPSIVFMVQVYSHLTGKAKYQMEKSFFGALTDTLAGMSLMFDEIVPNIGKLFADKTFNLYNTKISHVVVLGMLDEARLINKVTEAFIAQLTADKSKGEIRIAPYQTKTLAESATETADVLNKFINASRGKTLTAAIIRYKASGNDVAVLSTDNNAAAQFAKLEGEVNESSIKSGCRGLAIFRWIGDFWTDYQDLKMRKAAALREEHEARVQFLQMELVGKDPNSEEYKRLVKIIKNYEMMIDRINQKLDKYYNKD